MEVTPNLVPVSEGKGPPDAPASPSPRPAAIAACDEDTALAEPVPALRSAPPAMPDDLEPGTMLGEYRIERKIGQGGMGAVFAAVHPLIGKRAAIKVLTRELCADPDSVERFIDEARVVNQIGHPNIVDVFAFGVTPDGRHYFVMELLQGETLAARMAHQPLTLPEICTVLKTLARALDAAHDKGVIHRDLKPDNVFLVDVRGDPSAVKLLDFGIAKLSADDSRVSRTAAGVMMGTPHYVAPEQARGLRVDARADIYAFGVLLFELLVGRPPFIADNAPELIAKHLTEKPPSPSTFVGVPAELDDLVAAMLAKDPNDRPTLSQVHNVLDIILADLRGHLLAAPRPSEDTLSLELTTESEPIEVPPPWVSRRAMVLVAMTAVSAVAAFLLVRSLAGTPVERPPATARRVVPAPAVTQAVPSVDRESRVAGAGPAVPGLAPSPTADAAAPPAPASTPAQATHRSAADATAAPVEPKRTRSDKRVEPKHRASSSGRLELSIHGVGTYVVIVDGRSRGTQTELALPSGSHEIEVRAAGESTQRFSVQIEAGKTEQRDVRWKHDAAPPAVDTGDGRELMAPGDAVPKVPR